MSNKELRPKFTTPEIHKKGWGEEVWLANNEEYCGKLLKFNKGATFSNHYHLLKREHFFILFGCLEFSYIDLDNAIPLTMVIREGDVVEIPRGCPHQVKALEQSVIVEISTTHRDDDSYRIGKGDGQK